MLTTITATVRYPWQGHYAIFATPRVAKWDTNGSGLVGTRLGVKTRRA
jgi:hypothetical protein